MDVSGRPSCCEVRCDVFGPTRADYQCVKERCSEKPTSPPLLIDHTRHTDGPPLTRKPIESLRAFTGKNNHRVPRRLESFSNIYSTTWRITSLLGPTVLPR